jgi:uncharacterized RDD family membrane protein YckC
MGDQFTTKIRPSVRQKLCYRPVVENAATNLAIASPLQRAVAYLLDGLILALLTLALAGFDIVNVDSSTSLPRDAQSLVLLLVLQATYNIGFVATRSATPGKMAMRIVVRDLEGKAVQPDTAILRYVVLMIENVVLVGIIVSAVLLFTDQRRRTIHDRIAQTLVVKAQSVV